MIILISSNNTTNKHIQYLEFRKDFSDIKWYSLINTSLGTLPFFGKDITQSAIVDTIVSHYQELSDANKDVILYYPETCLHPTSQSELIGRLISIHEKNKLNLYLVSNSDHILNGLRSNVVKGNILSDKVDILFFDDIDDILIRIEPNGHIYTWPKGFFDQLDEDFNIIMGI